MKPNPLKYSMLAVGITTAMGITSIAMADDVSYREENAFSISNKASASYTVEGNDTEQTAESNEVVVNVTETGSFSLIATNDDTNVGGTIGDDLNEDLDIGPVDGDTVIFEHTLSNDGNVEDTYTINVANGNNDDFDYDLDNTEITYQVKDAQGNDVGTLQTIANGGQITLEPGQTAVITIAAEAQGDRIINTDGTLTVTAESAYLTGKGETATATNVDNAITESPIYAITKSATSNLGNKNIDLNNDGAYVDYTIEVKNEGTADGTDVDIIDALPDGLVAIQPNQPNYEAPTTTTDGTSGTTTPTISSDGRTITVDGQNIAQGETITVTFRAKAADNATVDSDFENYASVEDDLNGDGTPDITDSTDDTLDDTFEDPNDPNFDGEDTDDGSVSPKEQERDLTITPGADKEVPLVSEDNVYNYTITNEGTDVVEGDAPGEVLVNVSAITDDPNITVDQVFVDDNDNGILDDNETILDVDADGNFDLNQAAPNGLAPGESVNIGVSVDTNGSGSNKDGNSDIGDSETIEVTVKPQGEVDGTAAPQDATAESTTTMQGLQLLKYQKVEDCGTDPTSITAWESTPVPAEAGQCVFYKLEASNTFTDTNINNVVLNDTLADALDYQDDFASDTSAGSSAASPTIAGQSITGDFATLAGQETGNVYFSAKISQTGNNATP